MKTRFFLRFFIAVLTGATSLAATLVFGRALQRRAAVTSQQKPMEDEWFGDETPTSPEMIQQGRKLFLASCAHCHGADARGDEGPDLHDVQVSDRYIHNLVSHGLPHEMPSFAKKLDAKKIAAITAYIRTLE